MRIVLTALLLMFAVGASMATPIQVEVDANADEPWQITYRISKPVAELPFYRPSDFREETWIPAEGFVWKGKTLVRTDGKPFQTTSIRIPVDTKKRQADYQVFRRFTDGSLAMYTGHLMATLANEEKPPATSFLFRGDNWIVPDQQPGTDVRWFVPRGQYGGNYVYQGEIKPFSTNEATLLIDPGVPGWTRELLQSALPTVINALSSTFSAELDFKPFVLYSFVPQEGSATNSGGGTLKDQVEMYLEGDGWHRESEHAKTRLLYLLTHELVHLWNAQVYTTPQTPGTQWLHEGSADFFAWHTLRKLNLISAQRYDQEVSKAFNACLQYTDHKSIADAVMSDHQAAYSCGHIMHVALNLTSSKEDHSGAGALWRRMFDIVEGNEYNVLDWFNAVASLHSRSLAYFYYRAVHEQTNFAVGISAALQDGGATVTQGSDSSPQYTRMLANELIKLLMQTDCRGAMSIYHYDDYFDLEGLDICENLEPGTKYRTTEVQGINIFDSVAAWEAVMKQCIDDSATVKLGDADNHYQLSCPDTVVQPPPYWEITDIPAQP